MNDVTRQAYASTDEIRASFSTAMSAMYCGEVPAYGKLMDLVVAVNAEVLRKDADLRRQLDASDGLARLSEERHGAIRLGTAEELRTMGRLFAVMGMAPVGYYDFSKAGVPVHSTCFRPVEVDALARSPFRVFTSLLRLDLIADAALRLEAAETLASRSIFSPSLLALIGQCERDGGLGHADAARFVAEALGTFRWHSTANVSARLYRRLHDAHRLVADVVSFHGPHINHLTPRTLDIDAVQARMPDVGIIPKAVVEGPPRRACPILLRQTSFKALEEAVSFRNGDAWKDGSHTARFGEIEQRGIALTPRGRALYDRMLCAARTACPPAADGSNAEGYRQALADAFADFPDNWQSLCRAGLGYFHWSLTGHPLDGPMTGDAEALLAAGVLRCDPIIYEDFLPVSAAGIFQSNLGDAAAQDFTASPNRTRFEADLGAPVLDEFAHYAEIERHSLAHCFAALRAARAS